MNTTHDNPQARPWYREPWVWLVIALPAAAVIAGISTVIIATQGADSLVVDGFQKVGLIAQRESAADREAAALELVAMVSLDRDSGDLTARLESVEDSAMQPGRIRVSLHHPTRRDLDRATWLAKDASGLYRGNLGSGLHGRWYIQVESGEGDWRLSGRITEDQALVSLGDGS